jgi:hypothetical protein
MVGGDMTKVMSIKERYRAEKNHIFSNKKKLFCNFTNLFKIVVPKILTTQNLSEILC